MNRAMIVTALLGLSFLTIGTASGAEDLYGGVKGGVNIANQSVDPDDGELADSRTGMSIGGYVGIPVTPVFAVQPEALFTMKGDKEEADGASGSTKLNYIEVPVLARASFMQDASAHPSIFAGPSVGFNISAKAEAEDETGSMEADIKDQVNPIDFGVVVGGGLDIPFSEGKNSVGLDVRYTMGLNNINDSDGSTSDIKNGVFQIMGSVGLF
jgi:hypothetical protein